MNSTARYCFIRITMALGLLYSHIVSAQKMPFINYNTADGMINNRSHFIKQDGKGYIWIGTDFGIDRYDGRAFKHFPCPGYAYRASRFAICDGGWVIVSIDRFGIAVCCGDSVRFIKLKAKNPGYSSNAIRVNDSTFYIAVQNGLFYVKGSQEQRIIMPDSLIKRREYASLLKDRKGDLWIGASTGLFYVPHEDPLKAVSVPFFDTLYANCAVQDINGDLYIGEHSGVYKYSEAQFNGLRYAKPELVFKPLSDVTGIAFDDDNNIWMSCTGNGIYKYNKQTKIACNYNIDNGLVSYNTWDIFCDREQNIWVASENGVSKLSSSHYSSVDFSKSAYQNIKCGIVWNDSTLLFSNMVGLYSLTGNAVKKIENYDNYVGYSNDILLKLPGNKLMVNFSKPLISGKFYTYSGIYSLINNKLEHGQRMQDMPSHIQWADISGGVISDDKEVWINTTEGLQLYNNGKFSKVPELTVNHKPVNVVYITGGNHGDIWIIDGNRQVLQYSKAPATSSIFPYSLTQEEVIPCEQFSKGSINKLFVDSKGDLWVGTANRGLYMFTKDKNGNRIKRELSGDVLSNPIVTCFAEDKYNNIWVGTALGLDKVCVDKDTLSVTKDMYGNELCGKYIYFTNVIDNKLYVGSTGCVGIIDLEKQEPAIRPNIYISGIKVNERNGINFLDRKPSFEPSENTITFSLTGISYRDGQRIMYSYILEGLDEKWSTPTTNYFITYWHIPPGTYTFRARAISSNGLWSAQPAQFTFTIIQPFYTKWWFLAFCGILIAAVVYGIYRYRINKILEIQSIRQTISKDLHDDIGATVSSINILANMSKNDLVSANKRNQFLETIQEESKHVSDSLNDIVWSINPKNDSLDIIIARMQRYASEMFEAKNIAYRFILPEKSIGELRMDMAKRQHLYLVFKEAVNNLVKYSQATNAEVTIAVDKTVFTMIVADNGIGFDPHTVREGNGILNMKKRAEDIHAQLTLNSAPAKGVIIKLVVVF